MTMPFLPPEYVQRISKVIPSKLSRKIVAINQRYCSDLY